jgi:hypothetical protein
MKPIARRRRAEITSPYPLIPPSPFSNQIRRRRGGAAARIISYMD